MSRYVWVVEHVTRKRHVISCGNLCWARNARDALRERNPADCFEVVKYVPEKTEKRARR
jgi:hypothetical protein